MSILEVLYDIFTYVFLVFFPIMAVLGVIVCCEFVRWLRFDMKQPSSYEIVLTPSHPEGGEAAEDAAEDKRSASVCSDPSLLI